MYIIKLLKKNMKNYRLELYMYINANNAQSNNFEIPESTPSKVGRLSLRASIMFVYVYIGRDRGFVKCKRFIIHMYVCGPSHVIPYI